MFLYEQSDLAFSISCIQEVQRGGVHLPQAQLQQEERACKWSSEPANIKMRAEQMMDQQSENHSAMYVY